MMLVVVNDAGVNESDQPGGFQCDWFYGDTLLDTITTDQAVVESWTLSVEPTEDVT